MAFNRIIINIFYLSIINAFVIENNDKVYTIDDESKSDGNDNPTNVFDGVYTECFVQFSYTCLQKKTLLYLKELNRLNEISVIGDYVKFVKLNNSENISEEDNSSAQSTDELAFMIDKAVNNFFDNHLIRFRALGKDVLVPNKVEEFVGRKRRKGGGGGGGAGGGDGGKKKMMMMAMMCMKMKLMVNRQPTSQMLPAMMGMVGMMSFKGMMFSMMSFMISKMMLLMKILEKKGGGGGGGGGGGDGWAAGGGGGGAWMPAGGQDYGGGGGYDANGQWQSRSIVEGPKLTKDETPIVSYVKPIIRYNNKINDAKPMSLLKNLNDEVVKLDQIKPKSRKKRGIIDVLQNAYLYWASKVLGIGYKKSNHPKYKVINGVKYFYYPVRKVKTPKELHPNVIKNEEDVKPVVVDDFNKGEIVEGPIESRMIRKKLSQMKDNVNETVDDNPWE